MKTLSLIFCFALIGSPLFAEEKANCSCIDCKCSEQSHCGCMMSPEGHVPAKVPGQEDAKKEHEEN